MGLPDLSQTLTTIFFAIRTIILTHSPLLHYTHVHTHCIFFLPTRPETIWKSLSPPFTPSSHGHFVTNRGVVRELLWWAYISCCWARIMVPLQTVWGGALDILRMNKFSRSKVIIRRLVYVHTHRERMDEWSKKESTLFISTFCAAVTWSQKEDLLFEEMKVKWYSFMCINTHPHDDQWGDSLSAHPLLHFIPHGGTMGLCGVLYVQWRALNSVCVYASY